VDKAIELGIADPDRLLVGGHSHGGYTTYGIVTQTHRFKAAVAWAAPSDYLSWHGSLDARYRYADDAGRLPPYRGLEDKNSGAALIQPPWDDLGRYLRNSPALYADRVQTPVMIVQGDMDFVPLQQGEEFFLSLQRQNKRADLVRYWGEGHTLNSP